MAFNRNKLYLVFNENTHPVFIPTRDGGFILDAATAEGPNFRQMYFDDILALNSSSNAFRDGTLFFEKSEQEAIYDELRITDWKEIWHNSDIEQILVNPTIEDLQKIITTKSRPLFDRIRGVYIGMRNAGEEISQKARTVIDERQKEFEKGVTVSHIGVVPKKETSEEVEELKQMVADLAAKVVPQTQEVEADEKSIKPSTPSTGKKDKSTSRNKQ